MRVWSFRGVEKIPALAIAIVLYAVAVAGTTAFSYTRARASLLEQIDRELLLAASSVQFILADDFHDRALRSDAISSAEDRQNIIALSAFARRAEVAFLFSAIDQAGEARLTARSASTAAVGRENAGGRGGEATYFMRYDEGRSLVTKALSGGACTTATYSDRWGTFRAVAIPEAGPQGHVYVAAAAYDLSKVEGLLTRPLLQFLLNAALLLVAPLPVLLQSTGRLRLSEATLKRAVAARTRELERLARIDPLTGRLNRRAFDDALAREVKRAARSGSQFCIATMDLDWFKSVNDTYGHPAGDQVLQAFAVVVADGLRKPDVFARIGGEEFALLLPETAIEQAAITAERVCARVRALTITLTTGAVIHITVSIGVASSAEGIADIEGILQIADERLYLAKTLGRDRVVAGSGTERAGFHVRTPEEAVASGGKPPDRPGHRAGRPGSEGRASRQQSGPP